MKKGGKNRIKRRERDEAYSFWPFGRDSGRAGGGTSAERGSGMSGEAVRYQVDHLIYAAGSGMWNTIRGGLTLTEPVDAEALRYAVSLLPRRFPYFAVRLAREGERLYYAQNDAPFVVSPEGRAVTLGSDESNGHLLAFAYRGNTIYVDSSHFLMDGAGQFPLLKMLLFGYLHTVHPEERFDVAGIPRAGEAVRPEEATDRPYPAAPLPAEPLGETKRPAEVFRLEDQPQGYETMPGWTSYRLELRQKELMAYVSGTDGSPATFLSSLLYRAITALHPENRLPVVCGMQHQFRKALGNPWSHSSHVRIVPILYPDCVRGRPLSLINTLGRGALVIHSDEDHDRLTVNEHIRNEKRLENLTLAQKQNLMRRAILEGIGTNTFEVSYTGRVSWSGLDRYLTCFTPYLDMTLSGGISVEIFARGESFDVNIMQRNSDSRYVCYIRGLLEEMGLSCASAPPEHFEIPRFADPV